MGIAACIPPSEASITVGVHTYVWKWLLLLSASIESRVIPVKSAALARLSRSDLLPGKLISRATIA